MEQQSETKPGYENPFPGLRPFDINESKLFFGREHQVEELLRKLSLYHFVSVVGTSGSGKSSLVRAGLLARLYNGYNTENGNEWTIAIMRPGANPILNLVNSLFEKEIFGEGAGDEKRIKEAFDTLLESALGLIQIIRANNTRKTNFLLLVDQFEELFRFTGSESEEDAHKNADHFVQLLIEAVRQHDAGIYVVLTIRADFLGDCAAFQGLPEAINNGQYLIPRLNREHYKAAIVGPVNFANGKIAPRLVQQLLNDMNNNQDQLPILQHALMRTWEKWISKTETGEPMDLENYRAVGGMGQALNIHANEAYDELNDKEKKLAELIFKCVTVKGMDNRGIRRPTKLKDICAITRHSAREVVEVLDVFRKTGRGFIMPPAGVEILPETMVDISHESLMRNWERLTAWVDDEYESSQIYQRISESAILYQNRAAGLWRDPELSVALEWKEKNNPQAAWAAQYNEHFAKSMKFLDDSIAGKERMLAERKRRKQITNIIIIIFLVCAGGLTLWATIERGTASRSAKEAITQKSNAEKQESIAIEKESEAEKNFAVAEEQRKKALEQKTEAEKQRLEAEKQRKIANIKAMETALQTLKAKQSQNKAEDALKKVEEEKEISVKQTLLADSLKSLAITEKKLAEQQRQFSVAKSLALKSLSYDKNNEDSVLKGLLALEAYKMNVDNKTDLFNTEIISSLYEANKAFNDNGEHVLIGHTAEVKALATSGDGKYLASAGNDGKVILWPVSNGKSKPRTLSDGKNEFNAIAFSPDSKWLASCSDNRLYVWKPAGKEIKPAILTGHTARITTIVFTSSTIVSGGLDSILIFNKLTDNSSKNIRLGSRIFSLAWSKEKNLVAAGCEDGSIYTIDPDKTDQAPELIVKSGSQISALSFNAWGDKIAAAYSDGSLKVYYATIQKPQLAEKLAGHKSAVSAVVFGAGNQLASAGLDGKVKLWLFSSNYPPVLFSEHESWVMSMAMSPDGKKIYSGGRDKTIRIYDIDQAELVERLSKKITRNFTRAEWTYYMGAHTPYQKVVESLP